MKFLPIPFTYNPKFSANRKNTQAYPKFAKTIEELTNLCLSPWSAPFLPLAAITPHQMARLPAQKLRLTELHHRPPLRPTEWTSCRPKFPQ